MKGLRFERLAEAHLPEVLAIEAESNPAPWSEESFRGEITNPQSVFLVAVAEGRVAGFGGVWIVVDEAHVTTLAVAPELRRKRIGIAIMEALLEVAAARGARCSTLEVRAGNAAAIALYEGLGYVRTAERKRYYQGKEDAAVMWLDRLPMSAGSRRR